MARVYLDTDVDVDVNEFLDSCCNYEIEEVIDWLEYHGQLKKYHIDENKKNLMDIEWDNALHKLSLNRVQLTVAEEEFIKTIANRL
jgi:hypothetical protein